MDIYAEAAKRLIIPLWDLKDGYSYGETLRSLEASQHWPPERLRELQWERLKSLLRHAYTYSPFYRRRFEESGLSPEGMKSWDDFSKLPILSKDDIRDNLKEILATNIPRKELVPKRTGGSTGVALRLFVDRKGMNLKRAATIRHNRWTGYEPGDKVAMIWGNPPVGKSRRAYLRNMLVERAIFLDTLKMDEESMRRFVSEIRSHRPRYLMGHAHSIFIFARFLESEKIDDLQFDSVISTAMALSEKERRTIERVFGGEVYDRYGCEETSIIASECGKHQGLHINAEGIYLEVTREGGPAENSLGAILLTDLVNYGMPIIRYRVEDVGILSVRTCACGRGLPLLGEVRGRTSDFIVTPEGRLVFGISVLDNLTIHIPGFKQAQIVQEETDHLHFRIVKGEGFSEESLTAFRRELPSYFGEAMRYSWEFVDEIPRESSGKYRFTISKVKNPFY
jgi:phenylacetate-CoA ligase